MKLLATMGDTADEGVCRIVAVDLGREQAESVMVWRPPDDLRAPGKGFMGAAWTDAPGCAELLVCAHAAVCRVCARTWTITGLLRQPCMNDLHDVAVHDGRLFVTNTGLDRIDAFDLSGRFLGGWDLSPCWVARERMSGRNPSAAGWEAALRPGWRGATPPIDDEPLSAADAPLAARSRPFPTRKIRDFVHPNHIAIVEGRPLVTRFHDRSIQDLSDWSMAVPETPGYPHDGDVADGRFWITCTSGLIVGYAVEKGRVTSREVARVDVFERTAHSGWCRGLVVTDELFIVSLTAIQERPGNRWCDRPTAGTETSVVALSRRSGRLVARVDLGGFGRCAKVFTILPVRA